MAGLSTHSSTSLSLYMNQGKPHAVILTETHRELAAHEFNNFSLCYFVDQRHHCSEIVI